MRHPQLLHPSAWGLLAQAGDVPVGASSTEDPANGGMGGDTLLYPPNTPQLAPTLAGSGLGGVGGLSRAGGGRAASRSLSLGKMIRILGGAGARSPRTGHEPLGIVVRPDPQTLPVVAPDPQTLPMAGVGGPKAMNERG